MIRTSTMGGRKEKIDNSRDKTLGLINVIRRYNGPSEEQVKQALKEVLSEQGFDEKLAEAQESLYLRLEVSFAKQLEEFRKTQLDNEVKPDLDIEYFKKTAKEFTENIASIVNGQKNIADGIAVLRAEDKKIQSQLKDIHRSLNAVEQICSEVKDCCETTGLDVKQIKSVTDLCFKKLEVLEEQSKKSAAKQKEQVAILRTLLACVNEIKESKKCCTPEDFEDKARGILNDYSSHFDSKIDTAKKEILAGVDTAKKEILAGVDTAKNGILDVLPGMVVDEFKRQNLTVVAVQPAIASPKSAPEPNTTPEPPKSESAPELTGTGSEPPQHKSLPTKKIDYCPYCGIYVGVPENKKYIDERGNCTTCGQNIYSTSNIDEFIKEHTVKFYVNDRYTEEGMYKVFEMPKACQNDSLPIIYIPKKTCRGQIIRFLDTIQVARGYEENARRIKIIVVPNTIRSIGANNNSTFSAFGDKILVICLGNPHIGAVVREKTDIRLRNNL